MKPVLLASTTLQEQPSDECKRWSKSDKRVRRPYMVSKYNECMGGIDLIDRMIAYYRISARTNKWTVKSIFHFVDVGIANSWILYRNDLRKLNKKHLQFFDFKLQVSEWLFSSEPEEGSDNDMLERSTIHTRKNPMGFNTPTGSSSSSSSPLPNNNNASIRSRQHLPILKGDLKNSVRCKYPQCNKKTNFLCGKCNQFYCITWS